MGDQFPQKDFNANTVTNNSQKADGPDLQRLATGGSTKGVELMDTCMIDSTQDSMSQSSSSEVLEDDGEIWEMEIVSCPNENVSSTVTDNATGDPLQLGSSTQPKQRRAEIKKKLVELNTRLPYPAKKFSEETIVEQALHTIHFYRNKYTDDQSLTSSLKQDNSELQVKINALENTVSYSSDSSSSD